MTITDFFIPVYQNDGQSKSLMQPLCGRCSILYCDTSEAAFSAYVVWALYEVIMSKDYDCGAAAAGVHCTVLQFTVICVCASSKT